MLPNCPQYIVASFAILRLGAIVVNINPSYTPREALIIAGDSGARTVITLDALAPLIKGIQAQTGITSIIATSLAEYSAAAAPAPKVDGTLALADLLTPVNATELPRVKIASSDLAVLQYTGGTTGTPKGAMLTHGNIWANIVQTESWTNPAYILGGAERYLVVIPYFHIYAFSVCMMVGLRVGALQIIHPKYDPDAVLASIRDLRPTYFPAVPTVFVSLLNHPNVLEHGLERVRLFNSGGAPCPVEVMEEFERRIGRPLNEGYGLSETSPVTHSTPQLAYRKLGTIGVPFPDTDVKIVDVESGLQELPVGGVGEVCIAGPQVMQGYWNKPEESAHVLRPDAAGRIWFHTGDIGSMVDEVVDGDLLTGAIAFAKAKAANKETRKTRDIPMSADAAKAGLDACARMRASLAKTARGMRAPYAVVDAVEFGLQNGFDKGSVRERELFADCVVSTESKALRHLFFAEREVAKVPDIPKETPTRDIRRAAVVGAGTMGGGIAMNYANAGIPVLLKEIDQAALDRGMATIRKNYEVTMSKGKLTPEQLEKTMTLITPTTSYDGFDQVDIVTEAVFENMPAVLIELGYLSNPAQEKAITGDAFQNGFVQAFYDAVVRYRESIGGAQ